jgi:hypothetical protein
VEVVQAALEAEAAADVIMEAHYDHLIQVLIKGLAVVAH